MKPEYAAYGLSALAIVGAIILSATHTPVPEALWVVVGGAAGGGAGVSLQSKVNG